MKMVSFDIWLFRPKFGEALELRTIPLTSSYSYLCLLTLSSGKPTALEREGRGKTEDSWLPSTQSHRQQTGDLPLSLFFSASAAQVFAILISPGIPILTVLRLCSFSIFLILFGVLAFSINSSWSPWSSLDRSLHACSNHSDFNRHISAFRLNHPSFQRSGSDIISTFFFFSETF